MKINFSYNKDIQPNVDQKKIGHKDKGDKNKLRINMMIEVLHFLSA